MITTISSLFLLGDEESGGGQGHDGRGDDAGASQTQGPGPRGGKTERG